MLVCMHTGHQVHACQANSSLLPLAKPLCPTRGALEPICSSCYTPLVSMAMMMQMDGDDDGYGYSVGDRSLKAPQIIRQALRGL